ncbi:hypothetical protein [Carboxydothermus hydrogenoformans]|uniref:Chemotaxis methyl-accepting receptor HlyB-like 4HB MCP domain-containing protein n=1 Tax=Carboxydothermus hydrogenoformans (strain ATCC BAA-161 / DSM 6008 / Z-2901) TaxID=246194 RepID=Q3AAY8_CARHZ|nr:hypothetical protein [Carboxydothermus hydrogenoformans]ABB15270.1 hypothetical protein CHY_1876 [Carboxydothermus hydrogenoformans Z-2901]
MLSIMDNFKILKTLLIITTLLIILTFSVFVYNLALQNNKCQSISENLATGYAKMLSGDMIGLVELLERAEKKNFADVNDLWGIYLALKDAELMAQGILNLNPLLKNETVDILSKTRFEVFREDLRQRLFDFSDYINNRSKGLPVDKEEIKKFKEKIKKAQFPTQDQFSWEEFSAAVSRYFKN